MLFPSLTRSLASSKMARTISTLLVFTYRALFLFAYLNSNLLDKHYEFLLSENTSKKPLKTVYWVVRGSISIKLILTMDKVNIFDDFKSPTTFTI